MFVHRLVGLETNPAAFVLTAVFCAVTLLVSTSANGLQQVQPLLKAPQVTLQTGLNVVVRKNDEVEDICSYSLCSVFGCFSIRNDSG